MSSLVDISHRFEAAVRKNPGQPLICYALDENILSTDEYETLKDLNFAERRWRAEEFYGVLMLWVRNFYERSDGREFWSLGNGLEDTNTKKNLALSYQMGDYQVTQPYQKKMALSPISGDF